MRVGLVLAAMLVCFAMAGRADEPMEPKEGEALLFESAECSGSFITIPSATLTADLGHHGSSAVASFDHRVGCIRVGRNTKVLLYSGPNFQGDQLLLTRTADNPGGWWRLRDYWKHEVSSLKVFRSADAVQ